MDNWNTAMERDGRRQLFSIESIFTLVIFLFFVTSSFKNDMEVTETSRYWFSLTNSEHVKLIRALSQPILLLNLFLASFLILFCRLRHRMLTVVLILALLAYFIASIRGMVFDAQSTAQVSSGQEDLKSIFGQAGMKYVLGMLIFLEIYILTTFNILEGRVQETLMAILNALILFGVVFVALNLWELYNKHGFALSNMRMFGTASHPNIFGVQTAIVSYGAILAFFIYRSAFLKLLVLFVAAGAVLLLVQTGSRTSMLLVITGCFFVVWVRLGLPPLLGLALIASAGAIVFILLASIDLSLLGESFVRNSGRGNGDTRSKAWSGLWDSILDNPVFGNAMDIKFTENSFMRGWAMFGVVYAMIGISLQFFVFSRLMRLGQICRKPLVLFYGGLMGGLLASSMLEGFLADSYSLPIVIYSLLLSVAASYPLASRWWLPRTFPARVALPRALPASGLRASPAPVPSERVRVLQDHE